MSVEIEPTKLPERSVCFVETISDPEGKLISVQEVPHVDVVTMVLTPNDQIGVEF